MIYRYFTIFSTAFLLQIMSILPLQSQTAFEPLHRDVYHFLDRLGARGVIEYYDIITPVSRLAIAEKLIEISEKTDQLSNLEQRELIEFKRDFLYEFEKLNNVEIDSTHLSIAKKDPAGRWRMFSYRDSKFSINFSPIYGVRTGTNDGESESHRWNGAYLYGYLGKNWAYSFDFRDNREEGDNIDVDKPFSPVKGVDVDDLFFSRSGAIEYSEVRTTISYDWSWGDVIFGKDVIRWGHGQNGQVVLSDKVPSFPFVRLDLQPTNWMKFNYFHGWLASDVVDSTTVFPTLRDVGNSYKFREKFIASHTLTLTPIRGLDISLGESIVYSDRLEVAYLMPLMFFRLADHYLSDRINDAGSNAQIFVGLSARNLIPKTHFYIDFLIDDLSVPNIFDKEKQVNHVAATFGAFVTDIPVDNLSLRAEYSRSNPFVYKHYIPTLLYESSSYPLGHWTGHNSDVVFGEATYRILPGLQTKGWFRSIRKGGDGEVEDQYRLPHKTFLFGERRNFSDYGFALRYERWHELGLEVKYEKLQTGTNDALTVLESPTRSVFSVALYYGK